MTFFPVYQGGLPAIRTRTRQRGSGFFSAIKRFALPLIKKALPHAGKAVKGLITGQKPSEILATAAKDVSAEVVDTIKDKIIGESDSPPTENYIRSRKRAPSKPRKQSVPNKSPKKIPAKKKKQRR